MNFPPLSFSLFKLNLLKCKTKDSLLFTLFFKVEVVCTIKRIQSHSIVSLCGERES
jgi:hypothetical protein